MKSFKEFANSFQSESKLRLEGISRLCEKVGNPQNNLKFIHVAGTNGKGSVCAFMQCILTDSGLKCGKYISPNMIDVCERISIDGVEISNEDMDKLLSRVEKAAISVKEDTGESVTQFEIWTAAAFIYFKEKGCDVVVLETGLGGRLDATNVIENPILTIITKISTDHIDYLGDTIYKIAGEKAGILKKGAPLITISQEDDALKALEERAKALDVSIYITEKTKNHHNSDAFEIFDYKHLEGIEIGLLGLHQTENAALAIEAALMLKIDEEHIFSGLKRAKNIGRFEKIEEDLVFDGAHNVDGTISLVKNIERYFPNKSLVVVYGAMADKDILGIINIFKEYGFKEKAKFFTVTVEDNPRAQKAEILMQSFISQGFKAECFENIASAIKKAKQEADVVIICGSLYLYKDMKKYYMIEA